MIVVAAACLAVAGPGGAVALADEPSDATPGQRYVMDTEGQWVAVEGDDAEPGPAEQGLAELRQLLADERYRDAERMAGRWLSAYPRHPAAAQVHMIRGEARLGRNRPYRSLYDYEHVIRRFPETELFWLAMQREFEIAERFLAGERRRLLGLPLLPARGEGEELMIRIQERAPGSELAERAGRELADYHFRRGQWEEAAEAYDVFLELYRDAADRDHARQRLVEASMNQWRGPAYDPSGLIEARHRLGLLAGEFPALAEQIDADAIDHELRENLAADREHSARWYVQRGEPVSAAYVYYRLARQYPDTEAGERARRWLEELDDPYVQRVLPADWRQELEP